MPAYKDQKRGTWYVKYSYTDRLTGKRKQILKRGFETKRTAVQWEAEQRASDQTPTSLTFRALAVKYYEYAKPRATTIKNQTAMMENHFPMIDDPIDQISKQRIMEWYIQFTDKDLVIGTKNLVITVIKSIFAFGSKYYDLPNPTLSLKRLKAKKRKYDTWTVEEFERYIQAEHSPLYAAIITFMYWTGARKGEVLGLQYTDFQNGTVHIHQQMTVNGLAPLKTDSSERTLKLLDRVQDVLKPFLEACDDSRPFVFGGESPIPVATLYTHFTRTVNRAGLKQIRVHDLRHSFATNAIASGANIVAVSKYLGHASINITLSTYTHLLEKTDDEMVEIMNALSKSA